MKIKNKRIILLTLIATSFIASCSTSESKSEKIIIVKESDIMKESIGVNGMTCVGCEVTLEENISKIEGVVTVKASHTDKQVTIEFDSTKTDINAIINTIEVSGYNPFNK